MVSVGRSVVEGLAPMGRFGSPEDVAEAVLFLVSSRAGYLTGQVLQVNGGMYMQGDPRTPACLRAAAFGVGGCLAEKDVKCRPGCAWWSNIEDRRPNFVIQISFL